MGAIETMRIVEELMEIWPNEVCDKDIAEMIDCIELVDAIEKSKQAVQLHWEVQQFQQ